MPLVIICNISRLRFGFIGLEAPSFPLRQFFQCEAAAYVEVEASSAGGDQPHEFTTLIQTAPQQDQPGLQVVFDVRQPHAGIEPDFLVRERRPPAADEGLEQLPESRPGMPLVRYASSMKMLSSDR